MTSSPQAVADVLERVADALDKVAGECQWPGGIVREFGSSVADELRAEATRLAAQPETSEAARSAGGGAPAFAEMTAITMPYPGKGFSDPQPAARAPAATTAPRCEHKNTKPDPYYKPGLFCLDCGRTIPETPGPAQPGRETEIVGCDHKAAHVIWYSSPEGTRCGGCGELVNTFTAAPDSSWRSAAPPTPPDASLGKGNGALEYIHDNREALIEAATKFSTPSQ